MERRFSAHRVVGPNRRRRVVLFGIAVAAILVVLALVLVPGRTDARVLSAAPGTVVSTVFSIRAPSWVTLHLDGRANAGMSYWMEGPSGMMFNRSMGMHGGMMGAGTESGSYSFWTWGGDYRCAAMYPGSGAQSMPVWVNLTSAIL
jgi:hypothetical protein